MLPTRAEEAMQLLRFYVRPNWRDYGWLVCPVRARIQTGFFIHHTQPKSALRTPDSGHHHAPASKNRSTLIVASGFRREPARYVRPKSAALLRSRRELNLDRTRAPGEEAMDDPKKKVLLIAAR